MSLTNSFDVEVWIIGEVESFERVRKRRIEEFFIAEKNPTCSSIYSPY